jgi:predicted enzyme related to lactoylglutathione lyase
MGTECHRVASLPGDRLIDRCPPTEEAPETAPEVSAASWHELMTTDAVAALKFYSEILNGPMEVPGGDWIVNAMDPQGAAFSLHAKKPD